MFIHTSLYSLSEMGRSKISDILCLQNNLKHTDRINVHVLPVPLTLEEGQEFL